jgi:hypothetical protein
MASASSKRTLDTDYITLRKVFAKLSDNLQVPSDFVLTSVGDGRTYWASPSTLGGLPTFNEVQFDENIFVGTNALRLLRLNGSNGIFLSTATSLTTSSLQVTGQNFSRIDVSGVSSISAFSNFLLNNSLFIVSQGFLSSSTIPSENLVTLNSIQEAPALSTNIISYQALKVISSLSLESDTTPYSGNMVWEKKDISSFPAFIGFQDFIFRTNFIPPILGLELSSYSAKTFLDTSTLVATSFLSTISSISSLYTQNNIFSTALMSLSTTEYVNYSTNVSTTFGVSNYTQITYNQKFGDTMARATIVQLNDQFGVLNTGISTISSFKTPSYILFSTNQGLVDFYSTPTVLSTSTFLDFTAGSIFNFIVNGMNVVSTQLSTLSTSIGSNIFTTSNDLNGKLPPFNISTASTFANLGSLNYISSASLQSTVRHLGAEAYVSSATLRSSFSTFIIGFPSSFSRVLTSTTRGLNDRQEIISTLTLQSSIVSSTRGVNLEVAYTYLSTTELSKTFESTSLGFIQYAGSFSYISSQSLGSTLQSTVIGLSTYLYITTSQTVSSLQSTIDKVSFVSAATLQAEYSTVSNYVLLQDLQSTSQYFENTSRHFISSLTIPSDYSDVTVDMIPIFQGQTYSGTYDSLMGSNLYFSSIFYTNLNGFDTVIQNARFITIEYTPVFIFSGGQEPPYITGVYNPAFSTGIQIDSTFIPTTLFQGKVFAPFEEDFYSAVGTSNVFSKKIIMQLDRENFLSAKTNGFSIVHVFENLYPIEGGGGYGGYGGYGGGGDNPRFETLVKLNSPRSNALFISIYN